MSEVPKYLCCFTFNLFTNVYEKISKQSYQNYTPQALELQIDWRHKRLAQVSDGTLG